MIGSSCLWIYWLINFHEIEHQNNLLKVILPKDPRKIINLTLVIFSFYPSNKFYPFYSVSYIMINVFYC